MFKWVKKGKIFDPTNRYRWMKAYSQVPTLLPVGNRYRVFFTCRPLPDERGMYVSETGYIEISKEEPTNVVYIHDKPVLKLGAPGSFDEFGVHPCCLIKMNDLIYFYYQGWTRMASVPYQTSLGLAISKDGGETFKKYSKGPLFSRSPNDPYLENGFFVLPDNEIFHMWYASAIEWLEMGGKMEPVYTIVHATSKDGVRWEKDGGACFPTKYAKEANGRPTIVKVGDQYHMWFCYRNVMSFRSGDGAYRIGYATSKDLVNWTRNDELANITVSKEGWDSEMIAYPFVVNEGNRLRLFYNGNEFGKHGFGYAEATLD